MWGSGMKLGDIEYVKDGIFKKAYWLVCYKKTKHSSSSAIFYNFELARIYSEIIKLANVRR